MRSTSSERPIPVSPEGAAPSRSRRLVALALLAFALLYPFPHHERLNNPNENVRVYMTAAIAELGTYQIDALRKRWGWVNDAAVYGGHVYSVKAPGTSLLAVPAWFAMHRLGGLLQWQPDRRFQLWLCRVFGAILPMLLFFWWLYPWLGRQTGSPMLRDAVFFSLALGSLLYGYSLLFVSHAVAAACGFAAFGLIDDIRRGHVPSRVRAVGVGMLAASVTLFEYPGAIASAALVLWAMWVLRRPQPIAWLLFGVLMPAALVMHFHWSAFDNPFMPGHLHVETEAFRALHERGVFGIERLNLAAAWALLFDRAFGLFPLTPILLAALPGFVWLLLARDRRSPAAVALLLVLATWLAVSSLSNWRGGWTLGPRYLSWTLPFFGWAALAGLDALHRPLPRLAEGLALGALAAALLASGLPSAWYPHLPEAIDRPLPELFLPALAGGFTPHTAGGLVGLHGALAALPMALVALLVLALVATAPASQPAKTAGQRLLWRLPAGALVAALALWPLLVVPEHDARQRKAVDGAVAFVLEHWSPPDQDRASKLAADLQSGAASGDAAWDELADLYAAQRREGALRASRAQRSQRSPR